MEETILSEELIQRVKKGKAWLDKTAPEWVDSIRLESLQMDHFEQCVLGQVMGSFYRVIRDKSADWPQRHGFESNTICNSDEEEYEDLRLAWTAVVKKRRKKVKKALKALENRA